MTDTTHIRVEAMVIASIITIALLVWVALIVLVFQWLTQQAVWEVLTAGLRHPDPARRREVWRGLAIGLLVGLGFLFYFVIYGLPFRR